MTGEEIQRLRAQLAPIPKHVGIIMDGNGRWAAARSMPRAMGHRAGTERLRGIIRISSDLGIEALSLYAFSTENWKRPKLEVDALFSIFTDYFTSEVEALHANNVRISAMGDVDGLPETVARECRAAMEKTAQNTGLRLNIALNYGSQAELAHAARAIAAEVERGAVRAEDVDEKLFSSRMWVPDIPDMDLLIRTGGEKRLSNFMLLQAAYAELEFTDIYWPDFTDELYIAALRDFAGRNRRFGALK